MDANQAKFISWRNKHEWDNECKSSPQGFAYAAWKAGYALGAQGRQAQDARICKELGEHGPAEMSGAFSHAVAEIESTTTEPA